VRWERIRRAKEIPGRVLAMWRQEGRRKDGMEDDQRQCEDQKDERRKRWMSWGRKSEGE